MEDNSGNASGQTAAPVKRKRRHMIGNPWLRIPLKVLFWITVAVVAIPVALYIPPVQDFVKGIVCSTLRKSSGMDIAIGEFRLRWPLDVSMKDVKVVEASGDTMAVVGEAVADVKLAPLVKLDVRLNRLILLDAYYRMVSPDSSMTLKIRAGRLAIDGHSSADLKNSRILLNKAYLRDGDVSLSMDVWKKKPSDNDTASAPFFIKAGELALENFSFHMGMLPTIDSLDFNTRALLIRNAVIDLGRNKIKADYLAAADGSATYLTPTKEYLDNCPPVPEDTTSAAAPPMVIEGDTVQLMRFNALYAVKDAEPLPGFDPSYIQVGDVAVTLRKFLNAGPELKLPITRLEAAERCGLRIMSGHGTVALNGAGITLDSLDVQTLWSRLCADAGIPFALMEMKPEAPLNINASGALGMPDIEAFMPALSAYTSKIPGRRQLEFAVKADGTLGNAAIPELTLAMPGVFTLCAEGKAVNATDIKKLRADLDIRGDVTNPGVIDGMMGDMGFKLPELKLHGHATAAGETYSADFTLLTSAGDAAGEGSVTLTAENYNVKLGVKDFDVSRFAPEAGIGAVTATLTAEGTGFSPERPHARTDIHLDINSLRYGKQTLRDITAEVKLHEGEYYIAAYSGNPAATLHLEGTGTVAPGRYTLAADADVSRIDLQALGLSETAGSGSVDIKLKGEADPGSWTYRAAMEISRLNWVSGESRINLPDAVALNFDSDPVSVKASAIADKASLTFGSPIGLKDLLVSFTATGDTVSRQLKERLLDAGGIQRTLPPFRLAFNASGRGTLGKILNPLGIGTDTVAFSLDNDSTLTGSFRAVNTGNSTMRADTLTGRLSQRGDLLDYALHMGNRRNSPIAEFADVNLRGYLGTNRLLLSLQQKNQKGETGYRIGVTASYEDSVANLHFTPLKAVIAYLPWEFNEDNYIDYNIISQRIMADLRAKSAESSILLATQTGRRGNDELHVKLDNIHIQDFLKMSVFAPPVTASVDADLNVGYNDGWLYGNGTLDVEGFTYDKMRVGDFGLTLRGGHNSEGTTGGLATLKVDGADALTAKVMLQPDSTGAMVARKMGLELTRFPLHIANAFLGRDVARLSGYLTGAMDMNGSLADPKLNGSLGCDSVAVFIPMLGSALRFDNDSLTVADNVVNLDKFSIWGANGNPLVADGTVDARRLSDILVDLRLDADNFQLIGNNKSARSDIYGKVFLNMHASAKGPLSHMSVNADVDVLPSTDVTYSMPQTTAQLSQQRDAGGVVKFVNFNDTASVAKTDTVASVMSMRISAGLTIQPGAEVQVEIPGTAATGNGRVEISPSGTLNYFQNYMGDMRLNGQLNIDGGYAKYAVPVVGEKKFTFLPASYVHWSGDIMNPALNIQAQDAVRTNLLENGNSRIVNFLVKLSVTNNLSAPKVLFDLSTEDDMSIQNSLMSMSADQRSMAAINLLLTGQYTGDGVKTASNDLVAGTLYSMISSQVNNFLANNVKFVDVSVGMNQYNTTVDGQTDSSQSYSYTMSKSLFNNRFKISVGGNYTTDASADENFSENLISDISFEYIMKQSSTLSIYGRLFRHTGYESILEGEITETGVGFVMKRRLETLLNLFNFLPGRRKQHSVEALPAKEQATVENENGNETQK